VVRICGLASPDGDPTSGCELQSRATGGGISVVGHRRQCHTVSGCLNAWSWPRPARPPSVPIVAAVKAVQEHEAEWLKDLNRRRTEAKAKREEAYRMLDEAMRSVVGIKRTAHWVARTARNRQHDHISHDDLPVEKPEPPPDLAQILGMPRSEYQDEDWG
jgi:hypothetical protein